MIHETVVYVRKPRAEVLRRLHSVPHLAKEGGPADVILSRAGIVASRRIQNSFLAKSFGGTDETGERWAPLARATVLKRLRRMNPTTDRPSSALTPADREKWWNIYRYALAQTHNKATAAKIAWVRLKRSGGVGLYDKYGASGLLILRDTDALWRSLQPGTLYNVFRVLPGQCELGTSRPGATAHHAGAKNLPQRRLWPHPRDWTSAWWQDVLSEARIGLMQFIVGQLE